MKGPTMPKIDLTKKPKFFRTGIAQGIAETGRIERDGGDFGAGLIRGFAVITRGEALGHGFWIDHDMLQSVASAINASDNGIKSRFTHPTMSSDGLGKYLGRVKLAEVDGDVVRADLHLAESAKTTPDGNLADYVMDLAENDPDVFGTSIAFEIDFEATEQFMLDNGGERDRWGEISGFESPDELNSQNMPHIRISELRAVDTVDEPAANPSGLFYATDIPAEADRLLSYALGLSDATPASTCFGVDPDRASGFVQRFLNQHGLEVVPKNQKETPQMADDNNTEPTPVTREGLLAESKKYRETFGDESGWTYFSDGLTFEEALLKDRETLQAAFTEERDGLQKQIDELNEKLSSIDLGETEPVHGGEGGEPGESDKPSKKQLAAEANHGTAIGRFAASLKVPGKK